MLTNAEHNLTKGIDKIIKEYENGSLDIGDFIYQSVKLAKDYGYISKNIKNRLYTGPLEG